MDWCGCRTSQLRRKQLYITNTLFKLQLKSGMMDMQQTAWKRSTSYCFIFWLTASMLWQNSSLMEITPLMFAKSRHRTVVQEHAGRGVAGKEHTEFGDTIVRAQVCKSRSRATNGTEMLLLEWAATKKWKRREIKAACPTYQQNREDERGTLSCVYRWPTNESQ